MVQTYIEAPHASTRILAQESDIPRNTFPSGRLQLENRNRGDLMELRQPGPLSHPLPPKPPSPAILRPYSNHHFLRAQRATEITHHAYNGNFAQIAFNHQQPTDAHPGLTDMIYLQNQGSPYDQQATDDPRNPYEPMLSFHQSPPVMIGNNAGFTYQHGDGTDQNRGFSEDTNHQHQGSRSFTQPRYH